MIAISLCLLTQKGGNVELRHYLSLPLCPGELHLLEHLRALLHHQGLLVSKGGDITVVLLITNTHTHTQKYLFFISNHNNVQSK